MGAHDRAEHIVRVVHSSGPFAHRLIDSVLEDLRSALDRVHFGAQKLHAVDIELLPLTVQFPHEHLALHA